MRISSTKAATAFKFNDKDDVSESDMIDDTRKSEGFGSRFSEALTEDL